MTSPQGIPVSAPDVSPPEQALANALLGSNSAELFLAGSGNRGLPHKLTGREANALARYLLTVGVRVESPPPASPNDAALLDAYVAGCNAEIAIQDAEMSPENIRAAVAAAMRKALGSSPEPEGNR